MNSFKIYINDQQIEAHEGEKVLEIAQREKIFIPALCYHCDLAPHESCRLCMVEVEGDKNLRAACSLKVAPDMKIYTNTARVEASLITNLELTWAQHEGKCEECKRKLSCRLHDLAQRYVFDKKKFSDRKAGKHPYQFGPSIHFEPDKCINCENCSEMCAMQTKGGFIRPREGKYNFEVSPSREMHHDCIYCGQCIIHCPTGALSEVENYHKVLELINRGKKVVLQFAPAVRTSLGEEFGLPIGENVTDKIYSAAKMLGVYKIFDTSFAADVTIMEEAAELVHKVKSDCKEVMFSSCCPAWVKYVEFYEPDFIKNLTSVRSPQAIMGGLIKTYWAKQQKINPKDIIVVSVMPCTAKKFEKTRRELDIDGLAPIDYALTTREFAKMLRVSNIDLAKIEPDESGKDILADVTGAGEIFGASGGVLEAALRTGYFMLTGENIGELEFHELHKLQGVKTVELDIAGKHLRFAAVNGIKNIKPILEELKKDPEAYTCIEVMACPGGCVGGGGQPIPIDNTIRKARSKGLYDSDRNREIRLCHQSQGIATVYKEFLKTDKIRHKICHTAFSRKKKGKIKGK